MSQNRSLIDLTPAEQAPAQPSDDPAPAPPVAENEFAVTRILLCAPQALYRTALRSLLETRSDLLVAAECTCDLQSLDAALQAEDPDLVILDYDLVARGDVAQLDAILQRIKPRPTLIVSSELDPAPCQTAMRHGVAGIVLKSSDGDVLLNAVTSAKRGQVWLERAVLNQMFADTTHTRRKVCAEQSKISQLTPRERQIVEITCTGLTNKQIAEKLSISEATVRHHLGSVFGKLGVSTRSELVVYGYRHNLTGAVAEAQR